MVIVFASMSGNTEELAEIIEQELKQSNAKVSIFQIGLDDIMAFDLVQYDVILFGTYTWGDGDLPYELEDFYDDIEAEDLTGKKVALFGSCDSFYPVFGGALDKMAEQFRKTGAQVLEPIVKVDLAADDTDLERCRKLARAALER